MLSVLVSVLFLVTFTACKGSNSTGSASAGDRTTASIRASFAQNAALAKAIKAKQAAIIETTGNVASMMSTGLTKYHWGEVTNEIVQCRSHETDLNQDLNGDLEDVVHVYQILDDVARSYFNR